MIFGIFSLGAWQNPHARGGRVTTIRAWTSQPVSQITNFMRDHEFNRVKIYRGCGEQGQYKVITCNLA